MNNYKKKLDLLQSEEERYIIEKAIEYQEKLKLENDGGGWNDTTDAFRHLWGSAYLSLKYGDIISHASTTAHELSEKYQPKNERNMDEWNNSIGREIAKSLKKEHKDLEKSFQWSHIEDLIAIKAIEKIRQNKAATSTSDSKLENHNLLFKLNATKNVIEKETERKPKHTTLADLKQPQQDRINRVHAMIANHEEKLKNKKSSASKKSNSQANGSGRWITVHGRHIFVGN